MDYAYKERIGKPELFTGRKKELDYLTGIIDSVEYAVVHEQIDSLWETVRRKKGAGKLHYDLRLNLLK